MGIAGSPFRVGGHAIAKLRARLRGDLLQPGDRGYDEARSIWNGMAVKRPALIARVTGAADIVACVNFARDHDLPLSVRGGGHNVTGTALCDGGLTIDMSRRRLVRVDPERRIVCAYAGATWGDMDRELQPFGLVVPGGIVSATGVAGLAVGGGGGGTTGTGKALCVGGLTIDMGRRRLVRVDPERRIVCAYPGATWGDMDRELQPFGLVVPGGIVSATGVAGLTMGGGFGWTSRKFGFAADNLVSFDIVTADGRLLHVDPTENPELFWAVRGGGGNFGVVPSFKFGAHKLGPKVLCGMVVHPLAQARDVARCFREVCADAPDDLCCVLILRHAPSAPLLPPEVHGRPIAAIAACWAGDPATGEEAMRPLRTIGEPVADTIELQSFIAHQMMLDAGQPFGRRYYWKSHYCAEIGDGLIEALVSHVERLPSSYSAVLITQLGGTSARLDPAANAVGHRDARYALNIQAAWEQPEDDVRNREWALQCWASAAPFSTGGVYVNFMTEDEGDARLRAAYGEQTYAQLREIKARWDPGNLFRGAQNIVPAKASR